MDEGMIGDDGKKKNGYGDQKYAKEKGSCEPGFTAE